MSKEDLNERLTYFQGRLEEAQRRASAKEPHPRTFDSGYTTETFKTWNESIAVIKGRIAGIVEQLGSQNSESSRDGRDPNAEGLRSQNHRFS